MKINDIPENSIVRSKCNNQLYRLSYWETEEIILMLRYNLTPIDKNFKEEIFKHHPSGLRCESADHLTIIAVPNNGLSDLKKLNTQMTKFSKRLVVDAITFEEFIEYGKANGGNIVNGMPWSFEYKNRPVTHSSDTRYLICLSEKRKKFIPDSIDTSSGTLSFTPDDMLITGEHGEVYPLPITLFRTFYEEYEEDEISTQDCSEMKDNPDFLLTEVTITGKKRITKEEFAALLNGRLYGDEMTVDEEYLAQENGLLVCMGASDDILDFTGIICDEIGVYNGGSAFIIKNEDGDIDIDNELDAESPKIEITAHWNPYELPGCCWLIKTTLPHATFDIMEDGELYCRGIVIEKADIEAHLGK